MILVVISLFILIGTAFSSINTHKNAVNTFAKSGGVPQVKETPVKTGIFQYVDWSTDYYPSVDDSTVAPDGYSYALVTVHIKNTGKDTYSTNPLYWTLSADGITYSCDVTTFNAAIHHQSVNVGPGGETTTKFIYLVQGSPESAQLSYNGPNSEGEI